jgi:hypothetical protein
LHHIIQVLLGQQQQTLSDVDKALDTKEIDQIDKDKMERIYQRTVAIKNNNRNLLKKVLLVKSKMEKLMHNSMNIN